MLQIFLLFLLCCQLCGAPLQVETKAASAILMNAKTGAVLYDKEAKVQSFPASVTKIATALYLLDALHLDLNQTVTVSKSALRRKPNGAIDPPHGITSDSTLMGLKAGESFTIEDLLHGLMMVSGNDAANVLAEAVSGSVVKFMEQLNAYVRALGCTRTQFVNPHGYHHPEHVSNAYELCLLTKKALQIPKFCEIVAKPFYKASQNIEFKQRNKLMRPGEHFYPKAIGVKTGYHSSAKNNLVAAASHDDRTLIAVVLGCPESDDRYRDARALFDAAFKEEKIEILLVSNDKIYLKQIEGAKSQLEASLFNPLVISFYPSEMPHVRGFIYWDALSLPIRAGQKVGTIQVQDEDGKEIISQALLAQKPVDATFFFALKQHAKRVLNFLKNLF